MGVYAMFVGQGTSLIRVYERTGDIGRVQRRRHRLRAGFSLRNSAAGGPGSAARRRWVYEQSKRQAEETIRRIEETRRQQEELARALEPPSVSPPPPPPTSTVRDVSHLEAVRKIIEENHQAAQRAAELAKSKGSASAATGAPAENRTAHPGGVPTKDDRGAAAQRAPSSAETVAASKDRVSGGGSAAGKPATAPAASPPPTAAAAPPSKASSSAASSASAATSRPAPSTSPAASAAPNTAGGSAASSASAATARPAPVTPPAESSSGRSAGSETTTAPPTKKDSNAADGSAKAVHQAPHTSMTATPAISTTNSKSSRFESSHVDDFKKDFIVPGAPNNDKLDFLKKPPAPSVTTNDNLERPFATEWTAPQVPSSHASFSASKTDTSGSKADQFSAEKSSMHVPQQEENRLTPPREEYQVAAEVMRATGQVDFERAHESSESVGSQLGSAAPLKDRDQGERTAPKGFGAYIRRNGRDQSSEFGKDTSSLASTHRDQSTGSDSTSNLRMHRGGESPVPAARLHASRSPAVSVNGSSSGIGTGSSGSAEDLEYKVLQHLNTGKLTALTVPQLRAFLQQQKMPSAGKKKDLIYQVERWWQTAHHQKH